MQSIIVHSKRRLAKRTLIIIMRCLLCLFLYLFVIYIFTDINILLFGFAISVISLYPLLNTLMVLFMCRTGINRRCSFRMGALILENILLFTIITLMFHDRFNSYVMKSFVEYVFGKYSKYVYPIYSYGIYAHLLVLVIYWRIRKIKIFQCFELWFSNQISSIKNYKKMTRSFIRILLSLFVFVSYATAQTTQTSQANAPRNGDNPPYPLMIQECKFHSCKISYYTKKSSLNL